MERDRIALVTGATGFLGSHVAEQLLGAGYRVRALVRPGRPPGFLPPAAERVQGDLRKPLSLPAAVEGVDAVYHLAGTLFCHRPRDFFEINALGTASLLGACRKSCPDLDRFLLVSSLAAAGPSRDGRPLRETDPPRPVSIYGRSKLQAERRAREAGSDLPVTIVRPPIVYGPRDRGVLNLVRLLARGWRPALVRGKLLSIVYADDLARGVRLAGESLAAVGRTYHLAESRCFAFDHLVRLFLEILGVRARPLPMPESILRLTSAAGDALARGLGLTTMPAADKVREFAWDHWTADPERARRELGFVPRVGPEEGFSRTVAFYRANDWIPVSRGTV